MKNAVKLGIYAAAGVGVFAILKRYGVLNDVGRWLTDQVPEDLKRQGAHLTKNVRDRVGDVRERVGQVSEQVGERVGTAREQIRTKVGDVTDQVRERAETIGHQMKDRAQHAVAAASDAVNHFKGHDAPEVKRSSDESSNHVGNGSALTGAGKGKREETDDADGGHASHVVGRGVVR